MSLFDQNFAIIMGLFWTLVLVVPMMAYKSHSYSWKMDNSGNTVASNSFASSQFSSFNSNSMTSGTTVSSWPNSAVSESVSDEALDDKFSWKVMKFVVQLPGATEDEIIVQVYPADRNHPYASVSVRAERGEWKFEKDFDLIGLPVDEELPNVEQKFEQNGRLSVRAKFRVPRDAGASFDQNAFQQSSFSSGGVFRPPLSPTSPDTSAFNDDFFKNSGFGPGFPF